MRPPASFLVERVAVTQYGKNCRLQSRNFRCDVVIETSNHAVKAGKFTEEQIRCAYYRQSNARPWPLSFCF